MSGAPTRRERNGLTKIRLRRANAVPLEFARNFTRRGPLASLGMSNFRHLFLQSRGVEVPAVQNIRKT